LKGRGSFALGAASRQRCDRDATIYASVPAAVIVAGFLYGRFGLWATILWGVVILAGLTLYGRKRLSQSDDE